MIRLYVPLWILSVDLDEISVDEEIVSHPVLEAAKSAAHRGADGLIVHDLADAAHHEQAIHLIRAICAAVRLPVITAGVIMRLEDVKKYLYAGSACVLCDYENETEMAVYPEAVSRFGKEKTGVFVHASASYAAMDPDIRDNAGCVLVSDAEVMPAVSPSGAPVIWEALEREPEASEEYFAVENAAGFACAAFEDGAYHLLSYKERKIGEGADLYHLTADISWEDLVRNENGLIPVIVQDFENDEVLMMAWMDEAGFRETLLSGTMVYYSRSRKERWRKGETSGHFQYVRSLTADCDRDTLLAKVEQVGAACHTGSRSCFFDTVADTGLRKSGTNGVLEAVYDVIADRKINPKEGSYTNYLFEKGIDKILKKLGEENTETVIAAKNPGSEELVYEIADYLYHLMVLMAEKDVSWDDVLDELARRH